MCYSTIPTSARRLFLLFTPLDPPLFSPLKPTLLKKPSENKGNVLWFYTTHKRKKNIPEGLLVWPNQQTKLRRSALFLQLPSQKHFHRRCLHKLQLPLQQPLHAPLELCLALFAGAEEGVVGDVTLGFRSTNVQVQGFVKDYPSPGKK